MGKLITKELVKIYVEITSKNHAQTITRPNCARN